MGNLRRRLLAVTLSLVAVGSSSGPRPLSAGQASRDGNADRPYTTWRSYLGTPDSAQYSALKQINKSNVKQLRVAWTYPAGDGTIRFDPVVIRSEERRVGKECRSRWVAYRYMKK